MNFLYSVLPEGFDSVDALYVDIADSCYNNLYHALM